MAGLGSGKCMGGISEDRISNLPTHLKHCIVERLPVRDAARTVTLSKTWRNIWATLSQLILDTHFLEHLVYKKYNQRSLETKFYSAVSTILFFHSGAILKFHLHIPVLLDTLLWFKQLSKKSIRDFKLSIYRVDLEEDDKLYRLPSYFYDFSELNVLGLTGWILNPPKQFGGFRNLVNVSLENVKIYADLSLGIKVEDLSLVNCSGIHHLGCSFRNGNNLRGLVIFNCTGDNWGWFKYMKKLERFHYGCYLMTKNLNSNINFGKLFGDLSNISSLILSGFSLQFLNPGATTSKRLTTMKNLKYLELSRFVFYDWRQTSTALCLIRSLPNLQSLYITMGRHFMIPTEFELSANHMNPTDLELRVDCYLQSLGFSHVILDQLQNVRISGMTDSKVELYIVKLLLAYSPSLETIKISTKGERERSKIEEELMQFSQKSSVAIIFDGFFYVS